MATNLEDKHDNGLARNEVARNDFAQHGEDIAIQIGDGKDSANRNNI